MVIDRCEIARCRTDADLTYLSHPICSPHWQHFTSDNGPADALKMVLGVVAEPEPFTEVDMSKSKQKKNTNTKPEKAAPKDEPKEKVALRTVALRVPEAEFRLLHKAAGPRQLAAFMRTTLLAAANKAISK